LGGGGNHIVSLIRLLG